MKELLTATRENDVQAPENFPPELRIVLGQKLRCCENDRRARRSSRRDFTKSDDSTEMTALEPPLTQEGYICAIFHRGGGRRLRENEWREACPH